MTQEQVQIINFLDRLNNPWIFTAFILLIIWSILWKGVALWKAAINGSKPWFIAILILNTSGILEIIYIFFFSHKKKSVV